MTDLKNIFSAIIRNHVSPETYAWLDEKKSLAPGSPAFSALFVSLPRKTGKSPVTINAATRNRIVSERPGLNIDSWTIDRLARVWLLLHLDTRDREQYFRTIENLFPAAEVNELVALYCSLPVLAWPESWAARCAEGIRNNIADVLTAIMCNNPYPAEHLDEAAWNQMVLKAFFTEKPIEKIIGIDSRRNAKLASTLSDYAHERWAAHRTVNPQLWRCVGPFIDSAIFPDIQKIAGSENTAEQEAAALACYESSYGPAKLLIPEPLRKNIEAGKLSWDILAEKITNYVLQ